MTVQELEEKVWVQDEIRIVIRANVTTVVKKYTKEKAAQANWSISEFLAKRITPLIDNMEVMVLSGYGKQPHGRTLLDSVRNSYRKK